MARFSGSSGGGEGTPGPEGPAGPPGADGESFSFRGAYGGSEIIYNLNDVVTYNGSSYICLSDNLTGSQPDSLVSWDVFVEQGADGADGADANTGDITFDGIQIIGAGTASGDGYENGTIELVPDGDLTSDQYLIIDPTSPNHIHIRAGGEIDESTAHLYVGGERNHVVVSDSNKSVVISTAGATENTYVNANEANNADLMVPDTSDILIGDNIVMLGISYPVTYFSPDPNNTGFSIVRATGATFVAGDSYTFVREESYEHQWIFGSSGVLSGPAMGGVRVPAITNTGPDDDLYINAFGATADLRLEADQDIRLATEYGNIIINADGGEFLGSSSSPANQIATIGDLDNTVSSDPVRYSPTFTATGLAFTGSGATYPTYNSYYVKSGSMVSFVIEVDMSTVTNFGTGQYKLQLPFTPAFGFNHFAGWCWADPDVSPDIGTGHTIINADTAGVTDVLDLHYLKQAGGANSPIREGLFVQGTPVTMTTISKIYINGTYIAATEAP